jgi:hypothetical protein
MKAVVMETAERQARAGSPHPLPEPTASRAKTLVPWPIESSGAEQVDLIEGVRLRRDEDWVATIRDAARPGFHVLRKNGHGERACVPVEEPLDRIAGWRKEPA